MIVHSLGTNITEAGGLSPPPETPPPETTVILSKENTFFLFKTRSHQGRIQDFKLGGAHLKKLRGVFRLKNTILRQKNHIFSNCRWGARRVTPLDPPLVVDYLNNICIVLIPLPLKRRILKECRVIECNIQK